MTDEPTEDDEDPTCDLCTPEPGPRAHYRAPGYDDDGADLCGHHADALESGEWDGTEHEIELHPESCEQYETHHRVTGKAPLWADVSFSARSDGGVAYGGHQLTEDTVDDVDADLDCLCGDEFTAEADAIEHLDDVGAEVLTVLEGPGGEIEVVDRAEPAGVAG